MSNLFDDIFGNDINDEPTLTVIPSRKRGRRIRPIGEDYDDSDRQLLDSSSVRQPTTLSADDAKTTRDAPTASIFGKTQQQIDKDKNDFILNQNKEVPHTHGRPHLKEEKTDTEERIDENPNFTGRMGADGLSMGRTRGRDITDKNVEYPATSPGDTENISEATRHAGRIGGQESVDNTQSIQPGSDNISAGNSEDVPTYQGVSHLTTVVMKNVINQVADVLIDYVLKSSDKRRRRLKDYNLGPILKNSIVPQIMDSKQKKSLDYIHFATALITDPQATIIGTGVSMLKNYIDDKEGTNVFEELTKASRLSSNIDEFNNTEYLKQMKIKDISDYKMKNPEMIRPEREPNMIEDLQNSSLKEKAAYFIEWKAQGGNTQKYGGNYRFDFGQANKKKELSFVQSTVIGPYIVLCLKFYKALHDATYDINNEHVWWDPVYRRIVKGVLKAMGIPEKTASFCVKVMMAIPQELITAFQRNIYQKKNVSNEEVFKIQKFVGYIQDEYRVAFDSNYYDDVKLIQGKSMDLVGMMSKLHTPHVLHLFAIQLKTADDIVYEAKNNQGLFLGLLELASVHYRGNQDEGGDNSTYNRILEEETYVIGFVNYNYNLGQGPPTNIKEITYNKNLNYLNSLEFGIPNKNEIASSNKKNKTAIYKDGKNYVVALAGSKLGGRDEEDYINEDYEANLENMAGSPDFFRSEKYLESEEALKTALNLAKQTGARVTVVGYSLGALTALQLASRYSTIDVEAYEPPIGRNAQTDRMFKEIENRRGIRIYRVDNSSISKHLVENQNKFKINVKTIKQKKFSSHSLRNFN
jgi:hypothetical protein